MKVLVSWMALMSLLITGWAKMPGAGLAGPKKWTVATATLPNIPEWGYKKLFWESASREGRFLNAPAPVYDGPKQILLIVASTSLTAGDEAIKTRLTNLGYGVTVMAHTKALHPADLSGTDLVFISATVGPTYLSNKYKSANKPVVIAEPAILDDMGMTGPTLNTHYGQTSSNKLQTELDFVNSGHPIADGLSGLQVVQSSGQRFTWGIPGENASVIALHKGSTTKSGLFVYEEGAELYDGTIAAGKRGFLWLYDTTFSTTNATGVAVFDRVISWALSVPVVGDTELPTAPANLAASNLTGASFTLSWDASTDNVGVAGYDVYQDGAKLNSALVVGTTYNVEGLTSATTYSFTVRAKDAAGNESVASNALTVTTPDVVAPTAPTGLSASNLTGTGLTLNWAAATDNVGVAGYDVYKDGVKINATLVSATAYNVEGLTSATTYSFTVRAKDAAGNESAASSALTVTTLDVVAPTAPTGLSAANLTTTTLTLNWVAATDNVGVAGYDVYKDGVKINATLVSATTYSVEGLTPATTYSFTVKAKDAAGNESVASAALPVTTQSGPAPKQILMIVGSTSLNLGDNAYKTRLINAGYGVTVMAHTTSLHPADLTNIDLVFISSTVSSGNITNKYKACLKPVVLAEPALLDDMGMTGGTSDTHYGEINSQTSLNFVNSSHEIANGLSGTQIVELATQKFMWGVPGANADVIARIMGSSTRSGLFVYEANKLMYDNSLSKNKRGFIWPADATFNAASAIGQQVFDRMITWALSGGEVTDTQIPTPPTNLAASNITATSFTLSWSASSDNIGVTGYDVYSNGVKVNASTVTTTSYALSGLTPSSTYTMTVKAKDAAGNESLTSSSLAVTTLPQDGSDRNSFTQRTVISSQSMPWDITWGPDNQIWYTEKTTGTVSRVNPSTGAKQVLLTLGSNMALVGGQDGLMGMAIHPEFNAGKPFVYIAYTYQSLSTTQRLTRIQRYTYNSSTQVLESPVTVLQNIPGSNDHNSGRMAIGPDNKLYYTVGDMGAGQFQNASRTQNAQNLNVLEGKVLRLNLEQISGTWIPTDNPFTDGSGNRTAVYTLGHRNAQGLVWGNVNGTNRLYSSEHGPNSDDEVNLIESGRNYGWPQVAGYCDGNYNGWTIGNFSIVNEQTNCTNLNAKEPLKSLFYAATPPGSGTSNSTWPSVAPSGMDFYGHTAIPGWQNSLLIATLKNGSIIRLKLNSDGTAFTSDTINYFRGKGRFRDVIVSPDGLKIYASCDNSGSTKGPNGENLSTPPNAGSILEFTYSPTGPLASQLVWAAEEVEPKDNGFTTIYPNPARDLVNFSNKGLANGGTVELLSLNGRVLKRISVHSANAGIRVSDIPGGVYILRLTNQKGRVIDNKKLVIQH